MFSSHVFFVFIFLFTWLLVLLHQSRIPNNIILLKVQLYMDNEIAVEATKMVLNFVLISQKILETSLHCCYCWSFAAFMMTIFVIMIHPTSLFSFFPAWPMQTILLQNCRISFFSLVWHNFNHFLLAMHWSV